MRRGSVIPSLAFAVLAALLVPAAAQAQYFGRNQVRYRTFDFQVMKTEHFDIYYYPEEKEAIERAAPMAERWYARLRRLLGHSFSSVAAKFAKLHGTGVTDSFETDYRANLLRRLGRCDESAAAYRAALDCEASAAERRFLDRRLAEVSAAS